MNDETIQNLLTESDRIAVRPAISADLQRRVFSRLHRRRKVRRAAALTMIAVALLPLLHRRQPATQPNIASSIAPAISTQPSPWDALVEQRTAEAIVKFREHTPAVESTSVDPLLKLRIESDVTAATLLAAGDNFARDPASASQGDENYKRVQIFFPQTRWSALADRRLARSRS